MYHKLFVFIVYDFYGLELCTMYDSYVVYLCVLWIICMYKFIRCYVVVFYDFSFHLPIFDKNWPFSAQTARKSPCRFSEKPVRFIGVSGFTVSPSSPVRFNRIFLILKNWQDRTSDFYGSDEFLEHCPAPCLEGIVACAPTCKAHAKQWLVEGIVIEDSVRLGILF
jgi:hypothetical protein